jgi:Fe-S-cluster containining protein
VSANASESLCLRCGLCCDGSLFSFLGVQPGEVERLAARGLVAETRPDGRLALGLTKGCPGLSGKTCTLYEDRPLACRDYKCLLLVASPSPPSRQDAQRILRRHFLGRHRMD